MLLGRVAWLGVTRACGARGGGGGARCPRGAPDGGWQPSGGCRPPSTRSACGIAALAPRLRRLRAATLLILLHTQGNQAQAVALVLADLVLSPLLFIGAALLYLDQAARVK